MKKATNRNWGGNVKLTRRSSKSRAGFYREPERVADWSPSQQDWKDIEEAYGHNIPSDLRTKTANETSDYIHFSEAELSSPHTDAVTPYLDKVARTASALAELLVGDLKDEDAASARDVLRDNYFFDQDDPDFEHCAHGSRIADLAEQIKSLAGEASSLIRDLKADAAKPKGKKPSAWDIWVVRLTVAFDAHGLPTAVAKGSGSAFVVLIHELQERIPKEHRRFQYGHDDEPSFDATEKPLYEAQSAYRKYKDSRKKKINKANNCDATQLPGR